jgi:hypothetical protein
VPLARQFDYSAPLRLCVSFLPVVIAGCSPSVASPSKPAAVATQADSLWMPAFTDIRGQTLRPMDNASTKAVALVFILPDCPIANSYLPELNRLHAEFGEQGVRLLLVHVDPETTADQARQHAADYAIRPWVIVDSRHEWVNEVGASASPEAFVFSTEGKIVYRGRINDQYVALGKRRAAVTSHDLRDAMAAIVAGQPVPVPQTEAVGCPIPEFRDQK